MQKEPGDQGDTQNKYLTTPPSADDQTLSLLQKTQSSYKKPNPRSKIQAHLKHDKSNQRMNLDLSFEIKIDHK